MRIFQKFSGPAGRCALVLSLLFAGNGVALPFLGRWLETERGLTGIEIAAVLSSAQLARLFVGPLIAAWADGYADRRAPVRLLMLAALAANIAFFATEDFVGLLIAGFFAQTAAQAIAPLVEGALMRRSMEGGLSYGAARGASSVAFILGNLVGGLLVARFGPPVVVFWLISSLLAAAAASWLALSPDPAPAAPASTTVRTRIAEGLALFAKPRFALPIIAASLIQCAHAFYYAFSTLVWTRQGVDGAVIGGLWAFGVIVEVAFLWTLSRFEGRVAPEAFILAGGVAAALRWTCMALSPPVALLWPLQALHALTFAAVHVGAMRLALREAPPHIVGTAQTLYAALASGTLMGLAMLGSGLLYDTHGAGGYVAMAALGALGLVFAAFAYRAQSVTKFPRTGGD